MRRMSVWVSIAIVFLSGIVAGVLEAVLAAPLLTRVGGWGSLHAPAAGAAGLDRAIMASICVSVLLEALVVKVALALLTPYRIGLVRAAGAGMAATALGMAPILVLLRHPLAPGGQVPGIVIGVGLLTLPIAVAAIALQGWLVAVLAERPGSGGAFAGYSRALGGG